MPTDGWKPITEAFCVTTIPDFNHGHILAYFVIRSVIDGLPSGDYNSVSSSAIYLFKCGHVQKIEVCSLPSGLYLELSASQR